MSLDYLMNKHLNGQGVGELRNWKINPVDVDPLATELIEAVLYYVDADKKWKYYDGTELKVLGGEGGRKRGSFDASTGAVPTAANATVDPGVELKDGDYFVITVAGDITGLPNEESLEIGDLLYANTDAPAAAGDFYAVQTNIKLADNPVEAEVLEDNDILAGTPLDLYPNLFGGISSVEVYDSNGVRITDSVAITMNGFAALPVDNAGYYEYVTIETLVDVLSPVIILSGW